MSRQRECDYLNICRQTWQNSIIKKNKNKIQNSEQVRNRKKFCKPEKLTMKNLEQTSSIYEPFIRSIPF